MKNSNFENNNEVDCFSVCFLTRSSSKNHPDRNDKKEDPSLHSG